jgi:hypothetical protein
MIFFNLDLQQQQQHNKNPTHCNNENPQQKQQPTAIVRERERERERERILKQLSNSRAPSSPLKSHHLLGRSEEVEPGSGWWNLSSFSFKFFFFFSGIDLG